MTDGRGVGHCLRRVVTAQYSNPGIAMMAIATAMGRLVRRPWELDLSLKAGDGTIVDVHRCRSSWGLPRLSQRS